VVSRAGPHVKIPEWEQVLSAGAAAMSLVLAAHALGYGANWITEWYAYDRAVLEELGLKANEKIAGFIHIGRPAHAPEDRPRPPPASGKIPTRVPSSVGAAERPPPAHVLRTTQQRPRTAARPVQGDRIAAAGRLDHLDERQGRDQSRPLLVLQRGVGRPADRD